VNYTGGNWYLPNFSQTATGTALVAGSVYFYPLYISLPVTIESLAIFAVVGAAGVDYWNVGIYTNLSSGRPGTLLGSGAGSISSSTGFISIALNSNVSITTPGWYWLAFQASDTTQRLVGIGGAGFHIFESGPGQFFGSPTLANAATLFGVSVTGTAQTSAGIANVTMPTGPTGFSEITTAQQMPTLLYQVVSVP
jgi:hypothetical protein